MTNILNEQQHKRQTGGAFAKNTSLKTIIPAEEYLLKTAPLPISYDVNRPQHWYFNEYTYTEFMGGLIVAPMNDEMACRNIISAMKHQSSLDVEKIIYDRLESLNTLDKYVLNKKTEKKWKRAIILPGSNLLSTHVSKEIISKVMWEYGDDIVLKPHPLTNENDVHQMKRDFGLHRVLAPDISGWSVIQNAEVVYSTSSTEMSMYACLFGKQVKSIGSIFFERTGSYYPVFRHIADLPANQARKNLLKILKSTCSGIVFGEDPDYIEKINNFFTKTMKLRQKYKPIVYNSFSYPNRNIKKVEVAK